MPSDDLSSRDPGAHSTPAGGRLPGREADELEEATERLDHASWDPFDDSPMPEERDTGANSADSPGPIRNFLEQQLQDRPLPTLLAAVAAGWLVGKLLR
jgi:hypothetical protein